VADPDERSNPAGAPRYQLRARSDARGFDLMSKSLRVATLWSNDPDLAKCYAKYFSQLSGVEVDVVFEPPFS
jgi:hypothetical protein